MALDASDSTGPQPNDASPCWGIRSTAEQPIAPERRPLPSWSGAPSTLRRLKLLALREHESTKRLIKLLQSFPEEYQLRREAPNRGAAFTSRPAKVQS